MAHARADLFEGRSCVLTPTARTPPDRLDRARAFWSGLGCRLFEVDPVGHDERLALTSHLPHAVAAALAASVPPDLLPLAAGAYRDGTRVAGADRRSGPGSSSRTAGRSSTPSPSSRPGSPPSGPPSRPTTRRPRRLVGRGEGTSRPVRQGLTGRVGSPRT